MSESFPKINLKFILTSEWMVERESVGERERERESKTDNLNGSELFIRTDIYNGGSECAPKLMIH